MEWLWALAILSVVGLAWLIYGLTNSRLKDAEEDLENYEGVIDVRRKAQAAKHNDPDAIKRMRDKYNK